MGCGSSVKRDTMESGNLQEYLGKQIPNQVLEIEDEEIGKTEISSSKKPHPLQKKEKVLLSNSEEIFTDPVENVRKYDRKPEPEEQDLIINALKNHFVFCNLSLNAMKGIISQMRYCISRKSEYVFKQGDQATSFFVIQKGSVNIELNNTVVKVAKEGDYFGEIALLYNTTRSATIIPNSDCQFWILDRITFKKSLQELISSEYDENRKFIEEIEFFQLMTSKQKDSIAYQIITNYYKPGQVIFSEGAQADSYFVIKSGRVAVYKGKNMVNVMGPKDSFGEQALYQKSIRRATTIAEIQTTCLTLGRDQLTKILGNKVQVIVLNNITRWIVQQDKLLSQLTKLQQEQLIQKIEIKNCKAGELVLFEGQKIDVIIFVLEGCIQQNNKIIQKSTCFGTSNLLRQEPAILTEDLIMYRDGVLGEIKFDQVKKLFGEDFNLLIQLNQKAEQAKVQHQLQRKDTFSFQIQNLKFIQRVGVGELGKVYLVKDSEISETLFALKQISKAMVVASNLERHIQQEKNCMELCNFPLIMRFYRTFQDSQNIYFLLQFIQGIELFEIMRDLNLLNKQQAQFYIGTLILCLEYLHSIGIIYRDLKPENMMINQQGILYLVDLGSAKVISNLKGQKTFTIVGTPHYMAPEVLVGKGYSFNADLWSIGICSYEFFCGSLPYGDETDDPLEIYQEIENSELQFPSFISDKVSKRFILQLLSKEPEVRLGSSYASLKANPFFEYFDWDKLLNCELKPPYIPQSKNILDEQFINQQFEKNQSITAVIKQDQSNLKIKYKKEYAKNQDWDQNF